MSDRERFRQLLLLPRPLREQPEVVAFLRERIEEDSEILKEYVRWMQFECSLHWSLEYQTAASSQVVSEIRRQARARRGAQAIVLCVAVLMLLVGGHGVFRVGGWLDRLRATAGELETPASVGWVKPPRLVDDTLRNGSRLHAESGQFLMRMQSGAVVACVAPIDVEVKNSWELFVHYGQICVYVPHEARGFRTLTRTANVVDLGTVFHLDVLATGATDVQVLQGRVELNADEFHSHLLEAGAGCRVSDEGRMEGMRAIDPDAFRQQLVALLGLTNATSHVVPHLPPPPSVRIGDFTSASTGIVFRERSCLKLPEPLQLYDAAPGVYTNKNPPSFTVIAAGQHVTTYFIHAENTTDIPATGTLTFPGEILGLALAADQLQLTDAAYGAPGVTYPEWNPKKRRGAVINEEDDEIEVLPDRRTLRFKVSCSVGGFDQLRVFVAARGPRNIDP